MQSPGLLERLTGSLSEPMSDHTVSSLSMLPAEPAAACKGFISQNNVIRADQRLCRMACTHLAPCLQGGGWAAAWDHLG